MAYEDHYQIFQFLHIIKYLHDQLAECHLRSRNSLLPQVRQRRLRPVHTVRVPPPLRQLDLQAEVPRLREARLDSKRSLGSCAVRSPNHSRTPLI